MHLKIDKAICWATIPVLRIRIRYPDPWDPYVFGPSGSGSFYHPAK